MSNTNKNKRLAVNTLLLYFRMIIIMGITLFTSRIILKVLGVEDFGIYSVVGGVVTMFGIISGALSSAVSRFLNIEMGRNNLCQLQKIFITAINIHFILGLIIVILAEIIGIWFLNNKMTIPADRLYAANWVFHCSIITFFMNLISIPYNACIIAHENMKVFAYVSILEAGLRLLIVYLLMLFSFDKLILYSILMLSISIIIRSVYQIYCRKNYHECKYHLMIDKKITKQMFSFASWNMIGSSSVILSDQGVNILLNLFCNPIVNAARGIAMQVNQAINSFSQNFMMAINPQITKSYGANDLIAFKTLMVNGGRFSFCLLTIISLPVLIDTNYILYLWLGQIPDYTVNFIRLVIIYTLSESLSTTFTTGLLATGKVIKLQLLVGGCRMLNFPISYIVLSHWNIPDLVYIIALILSQLNLLIRLYLLKSYIKFSIIEYYTTIVLRQAICVIIPLIAAIFFSHFIKDLNFIIFLIKYIIVTTISITAIYYIVCKTEERLLIKTKVQIAYEKFIKSHLW